MAPSGGRGTAGWRRRTATATLPSGRSERSPRGGRTRAARKTTWDFFVQNRERIEKKSISLVRKFSLNVTVNFRRFVFAPIIWVFFLLFYNVPGNSTLYSTGSGSSAVLASCPKSCMARHSFLGPEPSFGICSVRPTDRWRAAAAADSCAAVWSRAEGNRICP